MVIDYLNFTEKGINLNSFGDVQDNLMTPTKPETCNNMIDLFPAEEFNNNHTFLDMFCKTGNFLADLKENRGVQSKCILAICPTKQSQMLVCRRIYGELLEEIECDENITRRGQIYYIKNYIAIIYDILRKIKDIIKKSRTMQECELKIKETVNRYTSEIFKIIKEQYMLQFEDKENFEINNIVMNPPYSYHKQDIYIVCDGSSLYSNKQCCSHNTRKMAS